LSISPEYFQRLGRIESKLNLNLTLTLLILVAFVGAAAALLTGKG
jgi:hypothetical protein